MPSSSHHEDEALKKTTYTRVRHPVIPKKHAHAIDVNAIIRTEWARCVKLTDAQRDLLRKEG